MKFLKKNWRLCCGLYALIYVPWFFYLERTVTMDTPGLHIINNALDDMIPFCEYFIIPYLLWFLYIAVTCVFLGFRGTNQEFLKFAASMMIGMSIALFICMIYPNGLTLRPDNIPDNFFGRMVAALWVTDTPTNVFPSIHVYNSLAVHIALSKCSALNSHRWIRFSSLVLCILICLSTVFLKQHSVTDVIGGLALMGILYVLIYVVDYSRIFKKSRRKNELKRAAFRPDPTSEIE